MDDLRRFSLALALTIWMWCEALSSWVGVEAALKGESGGVTGIVVETLRFVDFLTSL